MLDNVIALIIRIDLLEFHGLVALVGRSMSSGMA
jgi:hypothetical protein